MRASVYTEMTGVAHSAALPPLLPTRVGLAQTHETALIALPRCSAHIEFQGDQARGAVRHPNVVEHVHTRRLPRFNRVCWRRPLHRGSSHQGSLIRPMLCPCMRMSSPLAPSSQLSHHWGGKHTFMSDGIDQYWRSVATSAITKRLTRMVRLTSKVGASPSLLLTSAACQLVFLMRFGSWSWQMDEPFWSEALTPPTASTRFGHRARR